MYRCKFTTSAVDALGVFLILGLVISSSMARAGDAMAGEVTVDKSFQSPVFTTLAFSYVSWNETVELKAPGQTDKTIATFVGNSLIMEKEIPRQPKFGYLAQLALGAGLVSVGGDQTLVYRLSNQHWWSAELGAKASYHISPQIVFSFGPMALYRNVEMPTSAAQVSARSGATVNYGFMAELRERLTPNWEFRQVMGALATRATTYWSFGIGYKF